MSVSLSYFPHPHPPPPPPPSPPPLPLASSLHHHHRHHHPLLPILEHCNSIIHLKQIHARALRTASPAPNPQLLFLYTRILRTATTIDLLYASCLLDHPIPPATPNSFAWNSLIRAYARSSDRKPFAITLYRRMLLDGSAPPDKHTFPFVLKACAFLAALHDGAQIHTQLAKLGFASDVYVVNSLIHFYSSCGLVTLARHLFDGMPERSVVSWNVMIDGYVEGGEYEAALALFREMLDVFEPDGFTLQSVVEACGGLGALSMVMWAHAFLLRNCDEGFTFTHNILLINNSLLDAYSKCGSIAMARQLFDRMPTRDLVSWNAMILGLAMHGRIQESLQLFTRMSTEEEGLTPNAITFIGVLNACNHGGLVVEGRRYFDLMVGEFGIEPQLEHYGCMVDLLARAGFIDEALDMVLNGMPCKPDAVIWRSLLDACCKKNAGIVVSESMARQVLESEDADSSGAYVLLSRVYALANRWNDVGLVRNLMSQEGIRKQPGCSSIEMDGILHEFVAGDTSHPRSKEIYEKLQQVEQQLALVGYEPDSSEAPMVADIDGVKGDSLRHHSERLAIAFGLLCMKPGTPIRILKNLRVCRDCHTMTKLISHVYQVEIVMRDRIRFHHFKEGLCSCMDYW